MANNVVYPIQHIIGHSKNIIGEGCAKHIVSSGEGVINK